MLEINNLSKSFQDSKILDRISFKLDSSHIYGLIGKNGIGKTTILNCLSGVLNYEEGEVLLDGKNIQEDMMSYKKRIAYTPDECAALEYLTGKEYLEFIYSVYYPEASKEKSNELQGKATPLIKLFDMEPFMNKLIRSYSHGTKQKISLIASYLHDPDIWFLDEPLLGLDPKATAGLFKLFEERKANGKIVLVTIHDILAAEEICDTVLLLKDQHLYKTYTDVKGNDAFAIDASKELKS